MSARWPLLKAGNEGAPVKAAQRLLLHRGADLAVDGIFGAETEGAVKAFQSEQGLASDGVVGDATWPAAVVKVGNGSQGEPVTAAQELLAVQAAGLAADGNFGPETEKATREFQQEVGLAEDGIVGPHTWHGLVVANKTG
jgi:peptidoglycan hydrolase-like protein with peptidoglycan-binding domain